MEIPSNWASLAAAWLVTAALLLLARLHRRRRLNLPPGPKPWPIIGNLDLMGPLPHRSIHELSKKYGPLMSLRFGSFPVVVGSSVEMARTMLKTHDVTFAGRPITNAGKYTTYNYSDITWSQYGPYWRQARKMCIVELFSAKRLESYEYIRVEELKAFLRELHEAEGRSVTLKDHLSDLSLNVISRMVLGKKYTQKTEGSIVTPEEFKKMLDELFLLNGALTVGDSIPWLNFLDIQGYVKRMKELGKKFDRFLEHVLDEHNERRKAAGVEGFVAEDMVDVLLQLADDPDLEVKLERHGVKAFTQDLIAGGTESSAVTVEWAISELLRKPEVVKKATEELDRVIGRDSVWAIGRDPAVWGDPDRFRPERFIERAIDAKGQDFELLPFGSGRRMCPGYTLGLKVIQASLANLLHGFEWGLPEGVRAEDLDMDEIFGLSTPKKIPLVAVPKPRLARNLYQV
ncbi:hypothetical protein SAY86_026315 [Trapa natans]|uniref:Uncharacterized protein n=1 Tax=Trapa natans TaxID=22666 RepID=A0AAN7KDK4_TRANT|nr:hypothetical protein SAY86_026315 [Trapa natans]